MSKVKNDGFVSTDVEFAQGEVVATEENTLAVIKEETGLIGKMLGRTESLCTMKAVTDEDKVALYNAMSDPDFKLKEQINTEITVTDIYAEVIALENERTGIVEECVRIILIDKDKKSYQCVSSGVYNSLKAFFKIYGVPTWEKGLVVKPVLKDIGDKRTVLTLKLVRMNA